MRLTATALLLGAAVSACGDDASHGPIDAPKMIDAPPDAPPDVPFDAPPTPAGHHYYAMDSMLVPQNNTQARDYGMDLDGNQTVDNQFGMVLGTLAGMGFDIQTSTTAAVDRGQVLELFNLGADDLTTAAAVTLNAYVGATPMPPACNNANDVACRHHLSGAGTFTVATTSPTNAALTGAIVNGTLNVGPGHLVAPVAAFFGNAGGPPVYITLIGARVQATQITGTNVMMMKLAGAISQTDVDGKLIPAMRESIEMQVMKDCTALTSPPACGCASGSSGKSMLDLFDTDHNCSVTVMEVKNSSLIQALLAPDVTVEGQQALSYGVKATAVGAGFVAP